MIPEDSCSFCKIQKCAWLLQITSAVFFLKNIQTTPLYFHKLVDDKAKSVQNETQMCGKNYLWLEVLTSHSMTKWRWPYFEDISNDNEQHSELSYVWQTVWYPFPGCQGGIIC